MNITDIFVDYLYGLSVSDLRAEAVEQARQDGMTGLHTFALPDYEGEDMGARYHPNAEWNRKAGIMLAEYLKTII